MLRSMLGSALRTARTATSLYTSNATITVCQRAGFTTLNKICIKSSILPKPTLISGSVAETNTLLQSPLLQQQYSRTVTKFSLNKGKRKTVKAVLKRFKRLDWGAWIRTHTGRQKKLFKKSPALKRRLRQHIFTNSTQSWLLDKMVTNFWRRPKHYIDDPYTSYHKRDEFYATKRKSFKV